MLTKLRCRKSLDVRRSRDERNRLRRKSQGWSALTGGGVVISEVILVVLGLGIGVSFPNLTTAIQNAVERADLGAATATAAFFRSLGGAVGVALSGAILTARLPILMPGGIRVLTVGGQMPIAEHAAVVDAYRHPVSTTFLVPYLTRTGPAFPNPIARRVPERRRPFRPRR